MNKLKEQQDKTSQKDNLFLKVMTTSWPLGSPTLSGPYTATNAFTELLVVSAPIDAKYIAMITGNPPAGTLLDSPRSSTGAFQRYNIILSQLVSDPTRNQIPRSAAMQGLLSLQEPAFAKGALLGTDYAALKLDWYDQFALPSTFLTTLLAYANRNNVNNINGIYNNTLNSYLDSDIVAVWPHLGNSPMLTLIDAVTYMIKSYRRLPDLSAVAATLAEWRWLYPNRSRCSNPSANFLAAIIAPTSNITNTRIYPQGAFKWDLLRYDFFGAGINGSLETNNLLILDEPALPMANSVFELRYDYVAAPGNLLFVLKVKLLYDDGTGSTDRVGNNTSRTLLDPTLERAYPIVFRVGLEWLEDFIIIMGGCRIYNSDATLSNTPPLQAGTDLRPSLRFLYQAYLNAKRLYLWRIWNEIARYRVDATNPTAVVPRTGGDLEGVYFVLADGYTDYSNIGPNAPSLPNPSWHNLYFPYYENGSKNTLIILTSVEIGAYLSPALVNEGVVANKYGSLRIVVDSAGVPLRRIALTQLDFANPEQGTLPALTCFNSTSCWSRFFPPYPVITPPVIKGAATGNLVVYIIAAVFALIFIVVVVVTLWKGKPAPLKTVEVPAPKSASPPAPALLPATRLPTALTSKRLSVVEKRPAYPYS